VLGIGNKKHYISSSKIMGLMYNSYKCRPESIWYL